MRIRVALPGEEERLSAIAIAAKEHWDYAQDDLQRWQADLTVSALSLRDNTTFAADQDGDIAGFYQLAKSAGQLEIEHFWVLPRCMGRGIGRALLEHAAEQARQRGYAKLLIDADPNAEAFYLACGATRLGETAAPVRGDPQRVRPLLQLLCMH